MLKITQEQYAHFNHLFEQRYINKLTHFINEVSYYHEADAINILHSVLSALSDKILINSLPNISAAPSHINEEALIRHQNLAEACFYFCQDNEITDERYIRGFRYLLMERRIEQFQHIPSTWLT